MNVDKIREHCLTLPSATETLQWGDVLCFKVRGKMFAVLGFDRLRFTFKCTPDVFAELTERENILPPPYLARYNWVMLDRLDALPDGELREHIRQSYDMAAAKVPQHARRSKNLKRAPGKAVTKAKRSRLQPGKTKRGTKRHYASSQGETSVCSQTVALPHLTLAAPVG